ncbi:hypothetical protein ACMA5I_12055 [Paracoccaceae bacterium GXU_MW_L88]
MYSRQELIDYADISSFAYDDTDGFDFRSYDEILEVTGNGSNSSFSGISYYDETDNELVIGFGGTEGFGDAIADVQLLFGPPAQAGEAVSFAIDSYYAAASMGLEISDITFTGHSLGGYLAQYAESVIDFGPISSDAVVFNSPGYNLSGGSDEVTYIYSEEDDWDFVSRFIHNFGDRLSDEVYYVEGEGEFDGFLNAHYLGPLREALADGNDITQDNDGWSFWDIFG